MEHVWSRRQPALRVEESTCPLPTGKSHRPEFPGRWREIFSGPWKMTKMKGRKHDIIPWLGQLPLCHRSAQSSPFRVPGYPGRVTPSGCSWDQHRFGTDSCRPVFWQGLPRGAWLVEGAHAGGRGSISSCREFCVVE